jgi:hypothetical protein
MKLKNNLCESAKSADELRIRADKSDITSSKNVFPSNKIK